MKLIASLAIVVALSVAGCGGRSDESTPSTHQAKSRSEAYKIRSAEAKGALRVMCSKPESAKLAGCQKFRELMEREGR
jgi:hypothetical protein